MGIKCSVHDQVCVCVCVCVCVGGEGGGGGGEERERGRVMGFNLNEVEHRYVVLLSKMDLDQKFLPLDVDFINENASVANPVPTPRIASIHKSPFAKVVLMECWMEAVYYYVNDKTLYQLHTLLLGVNPWIHVRDAHAWLLGQSSRRNGCWWKHLDEQNSCGRNVLFHGKFMEDKIWWTLIAVLSKQNKNRFQGSLVCF